MASSEPVELGRRRKRRLVGGILQLGVHRRQARIVEREPARRDQTDQRQRDRRRDGAVSVPPKTVGPSAACIVILTAAAAAAAVLSWSRSVVLHRLRCGA